MKKLICAFWLTNIKETSTAFIQLVHCPVAPPDFIPQRMYIKYKQEISTTVVISSGSPQITVTDGGKSLQVWLSRNRTTNGRGIPPARIIGWTRGDLLVSLTYILTTIIFCIAEHMDCAPSSAKIYIKHAEYT